MATRNGYAEGIPAWVDLRTPEVPDALAFYAALFGWEYREEDTSPGVYHTALRRGLPAAGIGSFQDGAPQAWTSYFAVDDADSVATLIEESGGTILLTPSPVGTSGRLALAGDPTGAVFGIWEAGEHFGAAIVNEHGGLNWNELITDDMDQARLFYDTVFAYESEVEDWGEGHFYTTFKVGDRGIAGGAVKPRPEIPNHWNVYFAVNDAARAVETAATEGGTVLREARETEEVGIIARLADPYGAAFTIIELANEID